LDIRLEPPADGPEPERMLAIAAGAGFPLPANDNGALAIRLPRDRGLARRPAGPPYVVAHPGAAAPARRYPSDRWAAAVRELAQQGWSVVITGSQAERAMVADIVATADVGDAILDLSGQLTLAALADVLAGAAVVIVGNTGPAHLAAAVATPVVSLFSPVVSAMRWAPYGVPVELLGDQQAPCRATRSRTCVVEGHPCLAEIGAAEILDAVARLTSQRPLARLVPVLGGSP
jgi:ADP-heptose:LPS heptosyltransferase